MNTDLRDAGVLRAVREVMKRYEITEQPRVLAQAQPHAQAQAQAQAQPHAQPHAQPPSQHPTQPPAEADLRRFVLTGGSKTWQVQVDPAWQTPPHCDCPDARRVAEPNGATFCKHAIAVLLSHDDLRHQLIDLLI